MRPHPLYLLVIALAAVAACGKKEAPKRTAAASTPPAPPRAAGPAEYTVIVKSLWTKRNFPLEYPTNDARFSGSSVHHTTRATRFSPPDGNRPVDWSGFRRKASTLR